MTRVIDHTNLNDVMEIDHVVEVRADGTVVDGPSGVYAPELYDDVLIGDGWSLMNGYSGQDRYSGPVMHNSEYIGGAMARDILTEPGLYVAIVAYWSPEDDDDDAEIDAEGWAVAYRSVEVPTTHAPCPTITGQWYHKSTGACSCGALHRGLA